MPSETRCKHFGVCGGCKLQNISYDGQIAFKEKNLENLLGMAVKVNPSPEIFYYRNKAEISFSRQPLKPGPSPTEFENCFGFKQKGRWDKVVNIELRLAQTHRLASPPVGAGGQKYR
ncbi:MAG: hypothetical protein NTW04_00560 [Elusimicrobia bacterium]|nr:hypothetical protein [Elusimicrobiota bacterium]